ncbi:molecular chaperone [Tubulinosema ratisbonensis]|uniref:Molecular chaperone n=1 Tax=Tubulinosema ratisbonensis TaxID=291195 RepID=A0A437AKH7_9MICR|nr:molecular chaperone [Tubulinosema ratisbonensis]
MDVPVLGIDLGTTNTCLSIKKDKPEIILVDNHKTFPSIYNLKVNLVGHEVKKYLTVDPKNTFFATKRLIGKKFDDQELTKYLRSLPYKTFSHVNGDIWLKGDKILSPVQVAAKILAFAKKKAEMYLKQPVKESVITVPAYFDDHQRQATKTAAKLAGLNVLRILNEPTAAALAYGLDKEGTVAVFDLGGGTFDISILKISNGVFQVLSTNGNTFLGGEDIDFKIKEFIRDKLKDKNISLEEGVLKKLAEEVKVKLSLFDKITVNLDKKEDDNFEEIEKINEKLDSKQTENFDNQNQIFVKNKLKHKFTVKRKDIEKLAEEIVKRTVKPCKQAIKDAKISKNEIDHVILVGGMTRMPFVKQVVKEIFDKDPILVDPDTVVAEGAAIQGYSLKNTSTHLLLDVNSLSLGIETIGGVFSPIIKRNSPFPTKKTETFTTSNDFQEEVLLNIYQGERPLVKHNKLLGSLKLTIPKMKKGEPKIEVTFETDPDGILKIYAKDINTNKEVKSELFFSSGLTDNELEGMLEEAQLNEEDDKIAVERLQLINKINKLNQNLVSDELKEEIKKENFDVEKVKFMLKSII